MAGRRLALLLNTTRALAATDCGRPPPVTGARARWHPATPVRSGSTLARRLHAHDRRGDPAFGELDHPNTRFDTKELFK